MAEIGGAYGTVFGKVGKSSGVSEKVKTNAYSTIMFALGADQIGPQLPISWTKKRQTPYERKSIREGQGSKALEK